MPERLNESLQNRLHPWPIVAGLAAATWFALGLQWVLMLRSAEMSIDTTLVRYFSFFTILTNLLAAVTLTWPVLAPRTAAGRLMASSSVRAAIAVYITIVGVTYSLLLRQLWSPTGAQKLADVLLHDIVPLAYVLWWLFAAPKAGLRWRDAAQWLLYPLSYSIYTLAHGASTGWYPYPFIDVNALGLQKALLHTMGFLLAFWITGLIAVWIGRMFSPSQPTLPIERP